MRISRKRLVKDQSSRVRMSFRNQSKHIPYFTLIPVGRRDTVCYTLIFRIILFNLKERDIKGIFVLPGKYGIYLKTIISCPLIYSKHETKHNRTFSTQRNAVGPELITFNFHIFFVFSHFIISFLL